ncbi:hypothetical protein LTR84_001657 [Exophiala bonariae]|uniref:FAD-binding domain-containing protein n=1 Tax=Exophiala bonariae TaxID=1690606 RepID=A0AAV9NER8_9EURO|nr:hypothetical protein LTR84_001657 [Exophiala bonariae]
MDNQTLNENLKICIIGAGIGGLTCAIACRQQGLSVKVLEQAPEILPIGAGIQIPPNASRVLESLGILPSIRHVACEMKTIKLRRYENGALLTSKPIKHQTPWFVIHRADYHKILLNRAKELGVHVLLGSKVDRIDFNTGEAYLDQAVVVKSDVIIGADGLWSTTRESMLGRSSAPVETGDLAYRATFTREQLEGLDEPRITELCNEPGVTAWLGPGKHCVLYQVQGGEQINMVLIRPDDLASGVRTEQGDIGEMKQTFEDWDGVLTKIISCIPTVLKWKLMHHGELDRWVKGCVALLGDACHPTLPYQAQGAAMAVEDGAIIGQLLGRLNQNLRDGNINRHNLQGRITSVLQLYEHCQKKRTTINVQGALNNRHFYHMSDGEEQRLRDHLLAHHTWTDEKSVYKWCDMSYSEELLDANVLENAEKTFDDWVSTQWTKTRHSL